VLQRLVSGCNNWFCQYQRQRRHI